MAENQECLSSTDSSGGDVSYSVEYARAMSRLPEHIKDKLYGPLGEPRELTVRFHLGVGLMDVEDLGRAVERKIKDLPWMIKPKSRTFEAVRTKQPMFGRRAKISSTDGGTENIYTKFDAMIARNRYQKIAFVNLSLEGEPVPDWLKYRLQTACMSARYELPSDRRILQGLTPLQYLANYTRLYREQNRRYSKVFDKFKHKFNNSIEFSKLYPALNFLFAQCLREENFEVLCTALFMDSETVLDKVTFIGVCTFADRLFWTAYLDFHDRNSSDISGPNRTELEVVDFENLKYKLDGLSLSKEMRHLLYSLA